MDRDKMRAVANRMNRLTNEVNKQADKLAAQVKEGLLTSEEAAKRLKGFEIKLREELNAPQGSDDLGYCQLLIDQRLPGHNGLVVGRHI